MNCCKFHYDGGDLDHRCEGDPPGGDQGGHWTKPKNTDKEPAGATDCPKQELPEVGFAAIRGYVMAHFAEEQRPDQTVSAFVVEILEAVAKGNE
jgi:hypothetical protein